MDTDQILKTIRSEWQKQIDADSLVREVRVKIKGKAATYADAESLAIRAGRILSDLFRKYLPGATVDGRLFKETADKLIRRPLMDNYHMIAQEAEKLQTALNEAAGINIKAIVPDVNKDQIDGIIHGIGTAQNYEHYEESFLDQVENFGEGVVDDFVRENADFQYKAGLSPTIERRSNGKCCPWCSRLAGTYLYENVQNAGNEVFRRHRNCHCQVLFNPGDGSKRRQNVHTRKWTNEARNDRIRFSSTVNEGERKPPAQKVLEAAFREQVGATKNKLSEVIRNNHEALAYFTPGMMKDFLTNLGYDVLPLRGKNYNGIPFEDGGGYKIMFGGDGVFMYHPAGRSHHGGEYWKVSGKGEKTIRYDMGGNEAGYRKGS